MSGERITQAEFARRNGWSKQYVNKLVKQGRIRLEGGKIDPVAAKRAMDNQAESSTELQRNPSTPAAIPTDNRKAVDYASARTMREVYKAKMVRLDYEERESKLVEASTVGDEASQTRKIVRDLLLGIPDRMADVLAAEPSPERIQQLLQSEIEDVQAALLDMLSTFR